MRLNAFNDERWVLAKVRWEEKDGCLDIGCADGQWTSILAAVHEKVWAIDPQEEYFPVARKRCSRNVEFICGMVSGRECMDERHEASWLAIDDAYLSGRMCVGGAHPLYQHARLVDRRWSPAYTLNETLTWSDRSIDFVKIDAPGCEASLLHPDSAGAFFARHHPQMVIECYQPHTPLEITSYLRRYYKYEHIEFGVHPLFPKQHPLHATHRWLIVR